jgi:hypothetical protein
MIRVLFYVDDTMAMSWKQNKRADMDGAATITEALTDPTYTGVARNPPVDRSSERT